MLLRESLTKLIALDAGLLPCVAFFVFRPVDSPSGGTAYSAPGGFKRLAMRVLAIIAAGIAGAGFGFLLLTAWCLSAEPYGTDEGQALGWGLIGAAVGGLGAIALMGVLLERLRSKRRT